MKKLCLILTVLMTLCLCGTASAWYAAQSGYYEGAGNQVYYFEQGNQPGQGNQYTFIGGGSSGGGGAGGAGGNGYGGSGGIGIGGSAVQGQSQAVVGSGNSSVGNGIGNFSPKAEATATISKDAVKIDNKNTNTNFNTNLNSNKNENTNLNVNLNANKNVNKNENKNVNKNVAKQDQDQDQKQKQKQDQSQSQGQDQKQTANNEGNTQTINQVYEEKRDLIAPIPVPMVDPKLSAAKAGSIKVKGSLWLHVKSLTTTEVDTMLPEVFGADTKQEVRAISKGAATDKIVLADKAIGQYVATIYVISTGADMIACEAVAIKEAMKIGGTHIVKTDADFKVTSQGKSWGLGLGGGASMFGHDDTIAIAPSGGFGYGVADASNESLPQAAFTVYVDKSVKKTALEGPSVTGNFRGAGYEK